MKTTRSRLEQKIVRVYRKEEEARRRESVRAITKKGK